jgi:hypothetical protein
MFDKICASPKMQPLDPVNRTAELQSLGVCVTLLSSLEGTGPES